MKMEAEIWKTNEGKITQIKIDNNIFLLKQTAEPTQEIIQACHGGQLFLCPVCKQEARYSCLGLCRSCYHTDKYFSDAEFRQRCKDKVRKQRLQGYGKKIHLSNKLGNMDNIEKLCLKHGFDAEVAKAIAMDGVFLEEEMKKRGII